MNLPYFNRDKTRPFIKNLWLFFVFALLSFGANAQFVGCGDFFNITITNQYDMNQFALNYPGCTQIPGNLRIETSNITDLSQLVQITSVAGGIYIGETNLTNLNGLQNITHVGHDVRIRNNPLLTDISGLSNLNSDFVAWTGFGLEIRNNPQLSTCNLPNFCSYLLNSSNFRTILNNAGDCLNNNSMIAICTPPVLVCPPGTVTFNSQAEVNAFAATYPDCTQISGSLYINGNDITDLTPLGNITTVAHNFDITSESLTNLNGLQNLQKIGHTLYIAGTDSLTTLNGLDGLTEIKGELVISYNPALQDISALSSVDSSLINTVPGGTYGIYISNNPQLATCNISSLCSYLSNPDKPRTIANNAGDCNSNALLLVDCIPPVLPDCPTGDVNLWSQEDVNAFAVNYPNCTVIAGDLDLRNDITDLSPLSTIQSITGDLTINGVSLTHLNDLSNLTSVGGDISIYSNHYLQDISGLSGITTINSDGIGLTIAHNDVLTVCGIPNICSYLANPDNPRTIEDNAGNCGSDTVISYYCASPDCPMSDVFLYSQDDVNAFAASYPNCTQISGNLIINGATITDLSPLSNIQSITGNLNLQSTSLTHLDDLENLTSVKTLFITNNTQLQSIAGLSSVMELVPVTSLGLVIQGNSMLATCNIPSLCAYISNSSYARTISNNAGGCADNAALVQACYVPPACPEGGIAFTTQAQLNNFAINYPNCTNFAGSIVIGPSSTITDISPLSNLQTIGGELYISNLVYLQDLDGLDALTSVGGNLTIHSFGELQNVNALSSLTTVGGTLQISSIWNPQFQNLQGLNNLTSVGSLTIQSNSALVDLNALESLTHIDKNITIESNNVLDDISVLSQLDTTVPPNWITLRIINNPVLATCNLPYICSYITTPGAWFMINGNAGDCATSNNLIAACNSQPASCVSPSNLSVSSVTHNQASLDWDNGDNFNNFMIEFGPSGFTAGTGTVVSGITTSSYVLNNLEIGTAYDVYVHKNCGYNNSTALTTSFSTDGYCSPIATDPSSINNGNYIKNFATTGAITNISNVDSGYAANGYGNFSGSHSASHYPGQSIDFEAVYGNNAGTRGLRIWVDWNRNSVFEEASELVFSSAALQSGTHSGNFQIPANTAPGHYRMRLFLQENTLPADPCNTTAQAAAFGELEDYTLTVLEPSACNLDTVASANIISNKATINWTSPGSLFEMEWGPAGFAQGTGTQLNGITTTSYILEGLTEQTTYDVYVRSICTYNQSSWVKHTFATRSICPSGDLVLQTQAQIDDFGTNYPNCTAIAGNVNINGTNSNINNLAPLNNIVSISGGFTLYKLPQLTGVNGFTSLTTIGGSIDIYDTKLTNLNGLASLTNVGNTIIIGQNPLLTNISGIKNINPGTVSNFSIYDNANLAICNYEFICSYLAGPGNKYIANNATGCQNQAVIATACATCDAPANLTHVPGAAATYTVKWTSVGSSFDIEWGAEGFVQGTGTQQNGINTTQCSLPGLQELASYDIYIRRNCTDTQSTWVKYTFTTNRICPEINNSFYFYSQEEVDAFAATYPDCTQILGYVGIYGAGITNLTALSNIQNILWGITVRGTSLTSLNDLSSLTSVGGTYMSSSFNASFIIEENPLLTDISILDNIDTTYFNRIDIVDNTSLEVCNYPIICNFIATEGKTMRVSGNDQGCENSIRLYDICGYECPPSLEFNTQAEVNSFATYFSECTHINGSLTILDGVEDLSPLSNIESIQGVLSVEGTQLTDLNDLSSLTSIGGLGLGYNELLNDVSALENVTINPAGDLYIINNPSLSVCEIGSICNYLQQGTGNKEIQDNAPGCQDLLAVYAACGIILECPQGDVVLMSQQAVTDFVAMYPNCTQIEGNLLIGAEEQTDITDLSSLGNLEIISGGLGILGTQVTSLNGLSSLTSIGSLVLVNNPLLTDVAALENTVINLEGNLYIENNSSLSVCGISSICTFMQQSQGNVNIYSNAPGCEDGNAVMASCPLPDCPMGDIELGSQQAIIDFVAMYPNCTQIQGYLDIYPYEDQITDLSPLGNIVSVGGMLFINDTEVSHLNDLSSLTSIGGLSIWGNPLLTDISALENVVINPNGEVYITENPSLSVCGITSICTFLQGDGLREINDNAPGCENEAAVAASCDLSGNCDDFTVWNGTSWSNGTPDEFKRAVIKGDLAIDQNMQACKILLKSGVLTVNPGVALTVNGAIENTQAAANFIVESDANLIQLDDVENTGAITVKRNSFPLYRQDYTLWSSPVAGQNLRAFSPATLFNRFSSYDASLGANGDYVQEIVTAADMETKTFIDAKGYMIRMPNNWPVFVNEATPGTVYPGVFKGTPHNGSVAIPLSYANSGLNLVGNPYPSNISIESLFDANPDIQRVLYFWRKRNDVAGSGYATYTSLGLTSLNAEIDGLDLEDTIKPGQGFFVQANSATVLNFDNLMRTSGQNGHFLRSGNTVEKHRFWLNLSMNNQVLGQTLIGYVSGGTSGIDNGIDAAYFNDSALALTSLIEDKEYVIQGRSLPFADSDVVPLGFKSDIAGNFTISLSNFDGLFAADQLIYLKDNATGTLHDLKMADYSFASPTGVFNDRFEVQYSSTLGTNNPIGAHNAILIGVKNQNIQINAGSIIMEKVELIDVTGRIIYTQGSINAASVLLENVASSNQVLVVRISTRENGTVTQKIIF